MINLPIYRARRLDSLDYVEGFLRITPSLGETVIHIPFEYGPSQNEPLGGADEEIIRVVTSTLSIHFPDMLDSEGNKIFASLSEDGKGGDIIRWNERDGHTWTAIYKEARFQWMSKADLTFNPLGRVEYLRISPRDKKVIGIQK